MDTIVYVLITVGAIIYVTSLIVSFRYGKNKGYYSGFEEGYTNSPHHTEDQIIDMLAKSSTRRRGK